MVYCPFVDDCFKCDKATDCQEMCEDAKWLYQQLCDEAREAREEEELMLKNDGCWYDRESI